MYLLVGISAGVNGGKKTAVVVRGIYQNNLLNLKSKKSFKFNIKYSVASRSRILTVVPGFSTQRILYGN